MRGPKSIRTKFILVFLAVIVIPITLLGGIVYQLTYSSYYESLKNTSLEMAGQINDSIRNYMNIYGNATNLLAKDPNIQLARTKPECVTWMHKTFDSFLEQYGEVQSVYVGYHDKQFFVNPKNTKIPSDFDPRVRPWYTLAKEQNKLIWTEPYVSADGDGSLVVSAASPVMSGGSLEGVVAVDLDISKVADVVNGVKIGKEGYVVLLDKENKSFTHPDPNNVGKEIPVPELKAFVEENASGNFEYRYKGENRFVVLETMDDLGWKILAIVSESEIHDKTRYLLFNILGIGAVLVVVSILIGVWFSNKMLRNVKNISVAIAAMSEGDLRTEVTITSNDEFGKLSEDLNHMLDALRGLMGNVRTATSDVLVSSDDLVELSDRASHAAKEVSGAVEEVAIGATRQASDSDNSNRIANVMGDNIKTLTDSVYNMIELAKKASAINTSSQETVRLLKQKNSDNNEATVKTENAILALEKQSKEIGDFVQTISTIAEQTNLLALNASIEAARAGEHGRGFAVVADEIRKLAEQSGNAADEIKNIVSSIQEGSQNTVLIMQEVKERSTEQNEAVSGVEGSFNDIFETINQIQNIIGVVTKDIDVIEASKVEILGSIASIASVSEEAAAASEEVSASMEEQTAIVDQVANAADRLKELAETLEANINRFKS